MGDRIMIEDSAGIQSWVDSDTGEYLGDVEGGTDFDRLPPSQRKKEDLDAPVSNPGDVTLFPNSDKRTTNVIAEIRVHKLHPPEGFKGVVHPNATEEFIGHKFGNGTYRIEACNAKHKVLRSRDGLTISIEQKEDTKEAPRTDSIGASQLIIAQMQKGHDEDKKRAQIIADKNYERDAKKASEYLDMVKTTAQSSSERDKEFMSSVMGNQQQFFAAMAATQQQAFQQQMAMMTAGFNQTLQMQNAMFQQHAQMNSPQTLIAMMQMGADMAGDNSDKEPWVQAIEAGTKSLGSLVDLAKVSKLPPGSVPRKKPNPQSVPSTSKKPNGEAPLSREEIKKVIAFKQQVESVGMSFEGLVEQAHENFANMSEEDIDDALEPDSDESEETDTEETGTNQESTDETNQSADVSGETG